MTIKPIILLGLPKSTDIEMFSEIQKSLEQKIEQYYVISYINNEENVDFQVFFEKDFDESGFEGIKEYVKNLTQKQNDTPTT
jgi:hypothetical protein